MVISHHTQRHHCKKKTHNIVHEWLSYRSNSKALRIRVQTELWGGNRKHMKARPWLAKRDKSSKVWVSGKRRAEQFVVFFLKGDSLQTLQRQQSETALHTTRHITWHEAHHMTWDTTHIRQHRQKETESYELFVTCTQHILYMCKGLNISK